MSQDILHDAEVSLHSLVIQLRLGSESPDPQK